MNMRLICPNCGAQYEVDERAIPDAGRDVQCSNCGHAWFQLPEGARAKPAQDTGSATEPTAQKEPPQADEPAPDEAPGDTTDGERAEDPQDDAPAEVAPEPEPEPKAEPEPEPEIEAAPEASRRELDEGVRNILREEAEREARAREAANLETQDELGLEETPQEQPGAAQERMARLRGLDVEEDTTASGGTSARRDLLPDIEEINSSLESIGTEDNVDDFADDGPPKSGFGRGFILMLILAAVLVALYLYAPVFGEKVPALAPALDSYVGLVDQARGWLDNLVKLALSKAQSAE